jgi:hypothetical protein
MANGNPVDRARNQNKKPTTKKKVVPPVMMKTMDDAPDQGDTGSYSGGMAPTPGVNNPAVAIANSGATAAASYPGNGQAQTTVDPTQMVNTIAPTATPTNVNQPVNYGGDPGLQGGNTGAGILGIPPSSMSAQGGKITPKGGTGDINDPMGSQVAGYATGGGQFEPNYVQGGLGTPGLGGEDSGVAPPHTTLSPDQQRALQKQMQLRDAEDNFKRNQAGLGSGGLAGEGGLLPNINNPNSDAYIAYGGQLSPYGTDDPSAVNVLEPTKQGQSIYGPLYNQSALAQDRGLFLENIVDDGVGGAGSIGGAPMTPLLVGLNDYLGGAFDAVGNLFGKILSSMGESQVKMMRHRGQVVPEMKTWLNHKDGEAQVISAVNEQINAIRETGKTITPEEEERLVTAATEAYWAKTKEAVPVTPEQIAKVPEEIANYATQLEMFVSQGITQDNINKVQKYIRTAKPQLPGGYSVDPLSGKLVFDSGRQTEMVDGKETVVSDAQFSKVSPIEEAQIQAGVDSYQQARGRLDEEVQNFLTTRAEVGREEKLRDIVPQQMQQQFDVQTYQSNLEHARALTEQTGLVHEVTQNESGGFETSIKELDGLPLTTLRQQQLQISNAPITLSEGMGFSMPVGDTYEMEAGMQSEAQLRLAHEEAIALGVEREGTEYMDKSLSALTDIDWDKAVENPEGNEQLKSLRGVVAAIIPEAPAGLRWNEESFSYVQGEGFEGRPMDKKVRRVANTIATMRKQQSRVTALLTAFDKNQMDYAMAQRGISDARDRLQDDLANDNIYSAEEHAMTRDTLQAEALLLSNQREYMGMAATVLGNPTVVALANEYGVLQQLFSKAGIQMTKELLNMDKTDPELITPQQLNNMDASSILSKAAVWVQKNPGSNPADYEKMIRGRGMGGENVVRYSVS